MINEEALRNILPDINQQQMSQTTPPTTGVPAPTRPHTLPFSPATTQPTPSYATPPTTGVPAPEQEAFEFPFPEQWQTATDIYNQFAETGMPTDVSGMSGALWDVYSVEAQRAAERQLERAGLMGTRFGTPVGRRVGEEFARAGERVHAEMLPWEFAAQEAARGRQMGTAGGLTGLGGQYLYAPMNIAERMAGMGGRAQEAQRREIDPVYQNWLREQEENSPWLQYAMDFGGGQVPYGPQMYEPGWSSQLMDIGGTLGTMGMFQNWGQGGGGTNYNPTIPPLG